MEPNNKLGIHTLTLHVLGKARELGYKEEDLYIGSVIRIVFIAFAISFRYRLGIRYDIVFNKAGYGVSSDKLRRIITYPSKYSNNPSFEYARIVPRLKDCVEFDKVIEGLIHREVKDAFSLVPYITDTEPYKYHLEATRKLDDMRNDPTMDIVDIWLLERESESIWTVDEMLEVVGHDREAVEVGKEALTVPLTEEEYYSIGKYLSALEKHVRTPLEGNKNTEVGFTWCELNTLMNTPQSLIDAVEKLGGHIIYK